MVCFLLQQEKYNKIPFFFLQLELYWMYFVSEVRLVQQTNQRKSVLVKFGGSILSGEN